jgi:Low-density lipoprotein receptor repeat class B.
MTNTNIHTIFFIFVVPRYMFWTDWAPGDPSVNRADLDGSNVLRLCEKPVVVWPNGVTIDHIAERIYWVDAREDYIASADLDGRRFNKVIYKSVSI